MKQQQKYRKVQTLTIDAPKNEVWDVLADFNNVYTWAPSVEHSAGLNDKYQQVGSGRVCSVKGFGEITEKVTEWQDQQLFAFTVEASGPLNNALSHWQLSDSANGKTKITVTLKYDVKFGVLGSLLHALVMKKQLNKTLTQILSALKTRVETGKLVRPLDSEHIAAVAQG